MIFANSTFGSNVDLNAIRRFEGALSSRAPDSLVTEFTGILLHNEPEPQYNVTLSVMPPLAHDPTAVSNRVFFF